MFIIVPTLFTDITVDQVLEGLTSISSHKASGLKNICVKLLKLGKFVSKNGCILDNLKVARVIPISKGGE